MRITRIATLISIVLISIGTIANSKHISSGEETGITSQVQVNATIGSGIIKRKSGNNFIIASDDGYEYLAVVPENEFYAVNDAIYHSDPVAGWVDILGHQ